MYDLILKLEKKVTEIHLDLSGVKQSIVFKFSNSSIVIAVTPKCECSL